MKTRILGILGSLLLIAGVFCPIYSILGVNGSYYDTMGSGYNDGYIFVGIAALSLIIALININRVLIVTGLLALGMTVAAFLNFKSKADAIPAGSELANFLQLQWGWAVFALGSLVLLVAGILRKSPRVTPVNYGAPPPPGYNPPPPGYPPGPGQPPPYNR